MMRTMTTLHAVTFRRLTSCFEVSDTNHYQITIRQVTRLGSMKQEFLSKIVYTEKKEPETIQAQKCSLMSTKKYNFILLSTASFFRI